MMFQHGRLTEYRPARTLSTIVEFIDYYVSNVPVSVLLTIPLEPFINLSIANITLSVTKNTTVTTIDFRACTVLVFCSSCISLSISLSQLSPSKHMNIGTTAVILLKIEV
jgi:hypothetical protein